MENQLVTALKNNKILANSKPTNEELSNVYCELLSVAEGDIIYRQDEPADVIYLIFSGEVNLVSSSDEDESRTTTLFENEYFGDEPLKDETLRKCTAVALVDTYLIAISRGEVERLQKHDKVPKAPLQFSEIESKDEPQEIFINDDDVEEEYNEVHEEELNIKEAASKTPPEPEIQKPVKPSAPGKKKSDSAEDIWASIFNKKDDDDDNELKLASSYTSADDIWASMKLHKKTEKPESKEPEKKKIEPQKIEEDKELPDNKIKSVVEQDEEFTAEVSEEAESEVEPEIESEETSDEESDSETRWDFMTPTEVESVQYKNETDSEDEITIEDDEAEADLPEEKNEAEFLPGPQEVMEIESEQEEPEEEPVKEEDEEFNRLLDLMDRSDVKTGKNKQSPEQKEEFIDENKFWRSEEGERPILEADDIEEEVPEAEKKETGDPKKIIAARERQLYEEELKREEESKESLTGWDSDFTGYKDFTGDKTKANEIDFNEEEIDIPDMSKDRFRSRASEIDAMLASLEDDIDKRGGEPEVSEKNVEKQGEPASETHTDAFAALEQIEIFSDAVFSFNKNNNRDELLIDVIGRFAKVSNADEVFIFMRDGDGNIKRYENQMLFTNENYKIAPEIVEYVFENRVPVNPYLLKQKNKEILPVEPENHNILLIPVKQKNKMPDAVAVLFNNPNGYFTEQTEDILLLLAVHASYVYNLLSVPDDSTIKERIDYVQKYYNFINESVRNPLLINRTIVDSIIKGDDPVPEDLKKKLKRLDDNSNEMLATILKTFAFLEDGRKITTYKQSINRFLDHCEIKLNTYLNEHNCFITKRYGKDAYVKLDPNDMFEAIKQIIKNAAEASYPGGEIFIKTDSDNDFVYVTIKDFGNGIPLKFQNKIFEPLFSFGKKNSTGLGLTTAKKIIEDHAAKIEVESDPGKHTSITITFNKLLNM